MNKHIPDSITQENDTAGLQVSKIQFYEDDLKKLEIMSLEEAMKYKAELIDSGKYIEG